jgi:putative endonuclease
MYYVYVISSKTRKYIYVGITNNLNRRIAEHNGGYNKTTRAYRPFKLVLSEEFTNRIAAREREKYLKSGFGKEFLKKMI